MKTRIKQLALASAIGFLAGNSIAADNTANADIEIKPVKVVDPAQARRQIQGSAIEPGSIEVGLYGGGLSVEDFNTNAIYGLALSYHIDPRWMVQLNYGYSDVDKASFEEIADGNFLSSSDREFESIELLGGFNLFPGRSFFGNQAKYNSGIYLLAGAGQISFAGEDNTSLVLGSSYRVVFSEWVSASLDVKDHIVDREFLDDDKTSHNIEFSMGINLLF